MKERDERKRDLIRFQVIRVISFHDPDVLRSSYVVLICYQNREWSSPLWYSLMGNNMPNIPMNPFFNHNPMNHPYYCEYECPFYMGINIGIEFNIWHYMTTYGCLPKMLNPWPYMAIDRPRSEVHPEAEDLALETAPGPGPPPRFTALKASRIAVICFFGVNINKPRWIKSSICRVLET
jgi:hypothetical protein